MAFALPLSRYDYLYQLCSPCAHMSLVIFLCIYVRVSLSLVSRPPSWLCVSLYASTSVLLLELSQFSFVSPFIQQIKLRCFEFMFCLSDSAFVSHSCLHTTVHDTKWVELNEIILPSDFFFPGIWHCSWEYENYKKNSAAIATIGLTTIFQSYLEVQETFCQCHYNAI